MLAAALGSYFSITFSQQCIVTAHINFKLIRPFSINAAKIESVPQQPFCLPWFYTIFKLFRKLIWISGGLKRFTGKDCRGSVVTMTSFTSCRETGYNNIRLKFSYHPNNV